MLILLNYSCQKDEIFTQNEPNGQKKISRINFEEFKKINTNKDLINAIESHADFNFEKSESDLFNRNEGENQFIILTDDIVMITDSIYNHYTFKVLTESEGYDFYNLTLKTDLEHNTVDNKFLKYTPTEAWFHNPEQPYDGFVELIDSNILNLEQLSSGRSSGICVVSLEIVWTCNFGKNHAPGEGTSCTEWDWDLDITYGSCPETIDAGGSVGGGTGSDGGGDTGGNTGNPGGDGNSTGSTKPTKPCDSQSTGLTDLDGCNPATGDDDDCSVSDLDFNSYYSQFSPFQVDLIDVRPSCEGISTSDIDNDKFMCLYNKLIQSNKFKTLFLNTFEESQNLNVKFKLSDTLSVNGMAKAAQGSTINSQTGDLLLNVEIYINSNYLESASSIAVARTILHESIHAYLILKHLNCNLGTPFEELIDDINNKSLEELLNYYYETACPLEEQHEFMFDKMIPAMSEILADIRDSLIPLTHRQLAESDTSFKDENNPYGPTVPWDWNNFYKYLSMAGLQNTDTFQWNIPPGSHLEENFQKYAITYGRDSFRKECNE
ncbi:hypothetical protein [Paucihalobacter sp.]|uniref:hypothetical protein n=1 Tax=Paucihalobacter sp. TaxID=2850405 RepID=UPI002FE2643E